MTRLYHPIIAGRTITMVSVSGMTPEQAADYCRGIFGGRFEGFKEDL